MNTKCEKFKAPIIEREPMYRDAPMLGEIPNVMLDIPAGILVDCMEIPRNKGASDKKTYQRAWAKSRSREIARSLLDCKISLPLSFSINIRNKAAYDNIKNGTFFYDRNVHGNLYVMDGQHRLMGIKEALEILYRKRQDDDNRAYLKGIKYLKNMKLAVILTFTENIEQEMMIFSEINNNSKGVDVDTKVSVKCKRLLMGSAQLKDAGESQENANLLAAHEICARATKDRKSVWYNKIKFPCQKTQKPNVGVAAMCKYLETIIESPEIQSLPKDKQHEYAYKTFYNLWEGAKEAYPSMFGLTSSRYSTQKSIGADVLMRCLPTIQYWAIRNYYNNNKLTFAKAIKLMLDHLKDIDRDGQEVSGTEFWKSGSAAGNYSSLKGKKYLFEKMKKPLLENIHKEKM